MDRLVSRGVLFTDAYASTPVCSPSRAGWVTGRHQLRWDPKSSFNCGLPPKSTPHIAEFVKGTRLFNLREDPVENRDLAPKYPDVVRRLKKLYADWSKEVAASNPRAKQ